MSVGIGSGEIEIDEFAVLLRRSNLSVATPAVDRRCIQAKSTVSGSVPRDFKEPDCAD